jgi:phosphatidate cytidylyltransferase
MNASHIHRWLTAVIAVPCLFLLIYYGSARLFAVLIGLVVCVAAWEYEKIIHGHSKPTRRWEFLLTALIIPVVTYHQDFRHLSAMIALLFILLILCDLFRIRKNQGNPDIGLLTKYVLGMIYIPVLMSYFILIRGFENGHMWIFFILLLAFSGDVAAFYTGKLFGKTKLMPSVSPNKTVAGVVGLVLGSVTACLIFGYYFLPDISILHILAMSFWGCSIGQLGDLFESEIKRAGGIKDSGNILPGHGGVLDRIDCLLFIAPFIYYYYVYIVG